MSQADPPTQRRDFFISYNSGDRDWAEWIASELEAAGLKTFLQAWDITPGSNFVLEMQRAITSTHRTIAVLSATFLSSDFTAPEWAAAFAQDPGGTKRKLLPVKVRECQPEGLLAQIVHCNLVGLAEADARKSLLSAVRPERPAAGSVPFPTGGGAPFPGAPGNPVEEAIRAVRDLMTRHRVVTVGSENEIELHGRVFQRLADAAWKDPRPLIPRILERIDDGSRFPLLITGQPGSGKSTLLAVLYGAVLLRFLQDPERQHLPFLMDLSWFHTADPRVGLEEFESHLAYLRRCLVKSRVILLVDGVDEFGADAEPLRQKLAEFVDQSNRVRKVVAVAKPLDGELELSEIARGSAARLALSGVPKKDAAGLIVDYLALRKRASSTAPELTSVLERLRLQDVDLQTLVLLEERLFTHGQITSLADLYKERCDEQLSSKADRQACARLAFQLTVGATPAAAGDYQRHWRIMHSHESMRHFLVACHIVNQLKRPDLQAADIEALNYAYPRAVSHFCRELISFDRQKELVAVQAIVNLFPKASAAPKLCSHLAYLLGRVRHNAKWAQRTLREWLPQANQRAERPLASGHDLLFARSVYISLAYLEDRSAQAEYLQKLIQDRRWNRLNRGFHLEYYGDMQWNPREPDSDMANEDNSKEWSTTREALLDQLASGQENRVYEIDIFTLVSLAQRRLGTAYLSDVHREQIVELVEAALRPDAQPAIGSELLRDYLTTMVWQLRAGRFSPMSVVEVLTRIKSTPRRGWESRSLAVGEAVSSHSYSAALIAEVLLPERGPYNKREVVRMLMAHDLAECITGDLLPSEDLPHMRERERRAYRFLASCATHEGVEQLADWQEIYQRFVSQATLEAKIARDFDRLENLIQLMLFREEFRDRKSYDEFLEDLRSKIATVEVQPLRDAALRYFGGGQRSGGEWLAQLDEWERNSREPRKV